MSDTEMDNCTYNVHKQLVKRLQFLHHADSYIKQSQAAGHSQCESMWNEIVKNEQANVKLLQAAVKRDRANMGI
ncbi:hypothetical protein M1397_00235 [Candidatus Marsarchaeota archaeon]|nr:hypothetical protein [Candidatus Marsarchaeota archaeon]